MAFARLGERNVLQRGEVGLNKKGCQTAFRDSTLVLLLFIDMCRMTKLIGLLGILSVALLTGCASKSKQAEVYKDRDFNFLGIVKSQPANYTQSPSYSFALSSDEVVSTNTFSGDKVTLLWGLITLKDY
jgi:hypothetical protein